MPMSNFSEDGVMTVKSVACERLLEQRVERKLKGARAHDGRILFFNYDVSVF